LPPSPPRGVPHRGRCQRQFGIDGERWRPRESRRYPGCRERQSVRDRWVPRGRCGLRLA